MSILVNKNTKLVVQGITGREGLFHVRSRLVGQLGTAALHKHLHQVQRAAVDGRLGTLADVHQPPENLVGGGFVADLPQHRAEVAQEGIDLAGRVTDQRFSQTFQQPEVPRRPVEVPQPMNVLSG